jgi:arabinogalactan endo-1,4-beta-galactosidase
MNTSNKSGLLKDLKPNAEFKIKDTTYIVRNVGIYPIRIQVFIDNSPQNQNEEKSRMEGNRPKT